MKVDGSDMNNKGQAGAQAATPQTTAIITLRGELQKLTAEVQKALAGKITAERMIRIVMTAVQTTPKLAECSKPSFFGAVLQSCQLALEPNTPLGQAYLIPRWNNTKKCLECNFQMGYQGILELAYRTKQYKRITAEIVYEGDTFDYEYGLDTFLRHKPAGDTSKPIYVYALYELENGGRSFKVWSWDAVLKHAATFSESFEKSFSPWKANKESQEAMAKKTVLLNLLKYAPKTAEIASAVNTDERVLHMKQVKDGAYTVVDFEVELPPAPGNDKDAPEEVSTEKTDGVAESGKPAAPTPQHNASAVSSPIPGTRGMADGGKSGLFPPDEAAELEAQFDREQRGPDFDY